MKGKAPVTRLPWRDKRSLQQGHDEESNVGDTTSAQLVANGWSVRASNSLP